MSKQTLLHFVLCPTPRDYVPKDSFVSPNIWLVLYYQTVVLAFIASCIDYLEISS